MDPVIGVIGEDRIDVVEGIWLGVSLLLYSRYAKRNQRKLSSYWGKYFFISDNSLYLT